MTGSRLIKAGIIGIGDIARKAYLPVLSNRKGIELHLCTRNEHARAEAGATYRIGHLYAQVGELIKASPDCVFVNTATDAHYEVVKPLLEHRISVFVDKPITMYYEQSKVLSDLAADNNCLFMTGFNRRYAPAYQAVKNGPLPTMILMQKNRKGLPDELRRFVVEDFIHVVDTLRYLFPYPLKDILVHGMRKGNLLHHLTVQFIAPDGQTAIGIMNRDSGATEEKLEVMNVQEKRIVYNVTELQTLNNRDVFRQGENEWQSTLFRRGFDHMIDDFLNVVRNGGSPMITREDALKTHEICELIVQKLG